MDNQTLISKIIRQDKKTDRLLLFSVIAFLIPLLLIVTFGGSIMNDMNERAATTGMNITVYPDPKDLNQTKFIQVHETFITRYDYMQYLKDHNYGVPDKSIEAKILDRFVPFTANDYGTKPDSIMQTRIDMFLTLIIVSTIPLFILLTGAGTLHFKYGRLGAKAYCTNCRHNIKRHFDKDGKPRGCGFRIKDPERNHSIIRKILPAMKDCGCEHFELLDPKLMGKGPGKIKVSEEFPGRTVFFIVLILMTVFSVGINPYLSDYETKQALAQLRHTYDMAHQSNATGVAQNQTLAQP